MNDSEEDLLNSFKDDFIKITDYLTKQKPGVQFLNSLWKKSIDHFCTDIEANKILTDENFCSVLICLEGSFSDSILFDSLTTEKQDKFVKQLINLLTKVFKNIEISDEKLRNKAYTFLILISLQVVRLSDQSFTFSLIYSHKKGIKILFDILKSMVKFLINLVDTDNNVFSLCSNLSYAIFNLSKVKYKFARQWKKIGSLDILFDLANQIKEKVYFSKIHFTFYATISYLFEENEISKLIDLKSVMKLLADKISEFAVKFNNDEVIRRDFKLHENDSTTYKIAVDDGWNLIELYECLYRLAVSDSIKYDIYETYSCKDHLRTIIYKGNDIEQEYSLKILSQLCFDSKIMDHVKNDKQLSSLIKELSEKKENMLEDSSKNSIVQRITKICSNISWIFLDKTIEPINGESNMVNKKGHIMISYNSKSRDTCLTVKKELEKYGHGVWIDVENIHGSSLDSMAKAVEQSACILMCMTEKYKISANCRREAEYAVQQDKPIIPLIMERGYKPDGWLGIILGSKIFIDFTKYDLKECIRRLLKEIDNYTHADLIENIGKLNEKQKSVIEDNKTNLVLRWQEKDVNKWFEEKKFIADIDESVLPCNGELLFQMYSMLQSVPEFFYNSINSNKNLKLRDLAYFTNELSKIFKNTS